MTSRTRILTSDTHRSITTTFLFCDVAEIASFSDSGGTDDGGAGTGDGEVRVDGGVGRKTVREVGRDSS